MTGRDGDSRSEHEPYGDIATEVIFENDRVRIWRLSLAPGEETAVHRHDLDNVLVMISGDRIAAVPQPETEGPYSDYLEADVVPGLAIYVEKGGVEIARNVGQERYEEIIVELKEPRATAPGRSALERSLAHLVAHGDDGRVGQRPALPVGSVDDQRVAEMKRAYGDARNVAAQPELLQLTDPQRGLREVLLVGAVEVALDVGGHVFVREEPGHQTVHLDAVGAHSTASVSTMFLMPAFAAALCANPGPPVHAYGRADVDDRSRRSGREVATAELARARRTCR